MSYWLVPSETSIHKLQETVVDLSNRFGAPVFEPHVTIYVGVLSEQDCIEKILAKIRAAARSPLTLYVTGVKYSSVFTKTLYLDLASTPEATMLYQEAAEAVTEKSDYLFQPHLSLLYHTVELEALQTLSTQMHDMPTTITFDKIVAMATPASNKCHADVKAWVECGRISFSD